MGALEAEESMEAAIRQNLEEAKAVTWDRVKEETVKDEKLDALKNTLKKGFPNKKEEMPEICKEFFAYKEDLYEVEGIVLWKNRIVIPDALKWEVLQNVHSAHQGCGRMQARASTSFFWPSLAKDIDVRRARCVSCEQNTPSQQSLPAEVPALPEGPFQQICMDYCTIEGKNYLITVDRFSGWPDIRETPAHMEYDTKSLIRGCREIFASFGVPEELASDGGPQFKSHQFEKFLKDWGINHRKSSAYLPQSNGRAEVAVKSMKRLLTENISG